MINFLFFIEVEKFETAINRVKNSTKRLNGSEEVERDRLLLFYETLSQARPSTFIHVGISNETRSSGTFIQGSQL